MMFSVLLLLFFFSVGACIGSYLNVLIYRLPRGEDTKLPRSRCPQCEKMIPFYLNIPVISYILLKGRCRYCNNKIPYSYLIVECLLGLVSVLIMPDIGQPSTFYDYFFFMSIFSVFVAHFIIDLQFKILPNALTFYLVFIFGTYALIYTPWWHWGLGAALGFGFPYLITWLFYQYTGKIGLGGGDIKLYGALGIFLGPVGVMTNIFLSCFLGSVVTLTLIGLKLFKRDDFIPFGPFIIVVSFFQIFFPGEFSASIEFLGLRIR